MYGHWDHLGSPRSYRTIINLYCYGTIAHLLNALTQHLVPCCLPRVPLIQLAEIHTAPCSNVSRLLEVSLD